MITDMTKKAYTDQEEQIARFAKATPLFTESHILSVCNALYPLN